MFILLPPQNVQGETFTSLSPTPETQGAALAQVVGDYNLQQTTVLIEATRHADGFLTGLRRSYDKKSLTGFNTVTIGSDMRSVIFQEVFIFSSY